MARSDNPDWNVSPKFNFRIPKEMKDAADLKARLLNTDGYQIDDTFLPGTFDLAKYVRYSLAQFIAESTEASVARLGLTRKTEVE
jgi:hypothetical protein